jgi:hypothetical protein
MIVRVGSTRVGDRVHDLGAERVEGNDQRVLVSRRLPERRTAEHEQRDEAGHSQGEP